LVALVGLILSSSDSLSEDEDELCSAAALGVTVVGLPASMEKMSSVAISNVAEEPSIGLLPMGTLAASLLPLPLPLAVLAPSGSPLAIMEKISSGASSLSCFTAAREGRARGGAVGVLVAAGVVG